MDQKFNLRQKVATFECNLRCNKVYAEIVSIYRYSALIGDDMCPIRCCN